MIRQFAAICLALFMAGPAMAQTPDPQARIARSTFVEGTLNLIAGERVILRRLDDGRFELIKAEFVGPEAALPPAEGARTPPGGLNQARPGTVVLTLGLRRDVGSFLKIENGLDTGFKYTGYIVRIIGGQARGPARTSVCTVPAGLIGFEHWNEPVIQAIAGGLETVAGAAPECEPHSVNE